MIVFLLIVSIVLTLVIVGFSSSQSADTDALLVLTSAGH